MNTCSSYVKLDDHLVSDGVLGLKGLGQYPSVCFGYIDLRHAFTRFELTNVGGAPSKLSAYTDRENIELSAGATLKVSEFVIKAGPLLSDLLNAYAKESGERMEALDVPLQTGWCSWYHYYGTDTVDDIRQNLNDLKNSSLAPYLKTIQLDDGWNYTAPDAPRNWGDWEAGYKFPDGMKAIADEIKSQGFQPGLWLAPFSVDPGSEFLKNHPDLLVQEGEAPKIFWESYGLDLTNPGALEFLRETFHRVFHEWGYTYIKIDFLLHAIQPGRRYDPTKTVAEALRMGLQAIRDVAGKDNFILTCGCPMGPAVGIADAMRIGLDVSHRWYLPLNLEAWPFGNCSIYSSVKHVVGRQWMHWHWWQNDPDCLIVHDGHGAGELKMFSGESALGAFHDSSPYGLTEKEAEFWVKMVWMTGGMGLVGENISVLSDERYSLLEKAFPANPDHATVLDYHQEVDACIISSHGSKDIIGLFNYSDQEHAFKPEPGIFPFELSGKWKEWLSGEEYRLNGDGDVLEKLEGRSALVLIRQ